MKLLIIGNTQTYHLGAILIRAASDLGIKTTAVAINNYQGSINTLFGKVFYKFNDKRPLEWPSLNYAITDAITKFKPDLVIVTGIIPIKNSVFNLCHNLKIKIVNYLTDYPWNSNHLSKTFNSNISSYDHVFSTKTLILDELKQHNAQRVSFLPFAFDPHIHYAVTKGSTLEKKQFTADISFIGTGAPERIRFLEPFQSLKDKQLKIYGTRWETLKLHGWEVLPFVHDRQLSLATMYSKVSLGLVRQKNKDLSTMRTYEIPACGGCGIYSDTKEHRDIFPGYPDYGFFSSPEELLEKCTWLLNNPDKRALLKKLGQSLVINKKNTYSARLSTIIKTLKG